MEKQKKKKKKKLIIGGTILAVLAVFGYMVSGMIFGETITYAPNAAFTKGELVTTIDVTGTVESAKSENAYSTLSYPIKKVHVEVGDTVKAGQALAELDVSTLSQSISQSSASLETSKNNSAIQLEAARRSYEDAQALYDAGAISLDSLNTARDSYLSAQNTYNDSSDQIGINIQRQQLSDAIITAPIGGTVTTVNAVVGNLPAGNLFTIESLDQLIVKADVKEFDIADVKIGQKVMIKTEGTGDQQLTGTVQKISPTPENAVNGGTTSNNAKYPVEISIDQLDPAIKVGMTARVNIVTSERTDVFTVPYSAITTSASGEDAIFIAEEREGAFYAKQVIVTLGAENSLSIEINGEEIKEGLRYLTSPDAVFDGQKIAIDDPAANY